MNPLPIRRWSAGRGARSILGLLGCVVVFAIAGCSGGGGASSVNQGADALNFVFPGYNQQNVPAGSLIVVQFPGSIDVSTAQSSLALVDGNGLPVSTTISVPASGVVSFGNPALSPSTTYAVKATQALNVGDAHLAAGTTLTQFTTSPLPGATASGGLRVVARTPGAGSTGNDRYPYGTFNTLHLRFSEPVNPNSVVAGSSFTLKDGSGNEVPGNLYVSDRELSFDPAGDLTAGATYTVALTAAVTSTTGDPLQPDAQSNFNFTVQALSDASNPLLTEYLQFTPTSSDAAQLPASPVDGSPENSISLNSALIGSNTVTLLNDPQRLAVTAQLGNPAVASGNMASPFYGILPVTLRKGSQFSGSNLAVKLGGTVPGNLSTGALKVTLLTDGTGYFAPNALRADGQPTAATLILDLGITGGDTKGNGVLNQTVLGAQFIGTATFAKVAGSDECPDPTNNQTCYGSLIVDAVGSFPLKLVNNGIAIANVTLHLVTPAGKTVADTTPPVLQSQSPSACQYAFGSGNGAVAESDEATCASGGVTINSFPITGSPALTFSKPLDPATLLDQAGDLQFTTAGGAAVPFSVSTDGSSVILHPSSPLTPATQYTITAGAQLADLNGNVLGTPSTVTFTTAPYVATPTAAAFLTALTPGLPCALTGGDFASGGANAGYCLGDTPPSGTTQQVFPVFTQPLNRVVRASFSKPVAASSLVAANGCLTTPASGATTATSGSFALETVNASGQCTGVVAGGVELPQPGATQTSSFRYQTTAPLTQGQRYWLVICGNSGSACTTTQRVTDIDGHVLNTDPLLGSGSNGADASGGPDLIMPFDATASSDRFFVTLRALPATDTNGNGLVDSGESHQTATHGVVSLLGTSNDTYIAGDRPLELAPATSDCSSAPVSVIGSTPSTCVPIILFSGGEFDLTDIDVGLQSVVSTIPGISTILSNLGLSLSAVPALASTGRLILRLQGGTDSGGSIIPYQTGYIVPECTGTLNGNAYDYAPCIAVTLNLWLNAPDASATVSIAQQATAVTLVGPLSFQQDGLLSIDLQNTTTVNVTATALGLLPLTASINPGGLQLQLVSQPIHGN